jgi:L-rhamnose mutarotase
MGGRSMPGGRWAGVPADTNSRGAALSEHAGAGNGVEHHLMSIQLLPGAEAEYERRHDEIWPEMVAALHEAGFSEMRLFRNEQTVTIYSVCHPDAETAWARLREMDVNTRWDAAGAHLLVQPVTLTVSPEMWVLG